MKTTLKKWLDYYGNNIKVFKDYEEEIEKENYSMYLEILFEKGNNNEFILSK